jgi:signal transduction histidine kinase
MGQDGETPRGNPVFFARPAHLMDLNASMSSGQRSSDPSPQEQIDALTAQLREAQKLTALGELASTTTHEFNNVLTTIINYARMGQRHHDQATRDKAFEKILAASQRAAKITSSILGFARNRARGLEPTDLVRLVEDVLLLLEREMSKYHVMVDKQFQHVPPALVDGNQIQQVLINLLINARQAMPNGGRAIIRLAYDPSANTVDLTVRDTGTGIAPDKLPRIFDRFFTTKSGPDASGKGGTGLGLAFCRDVVEAHHGRIRVESTQGKGTAFTVKLPAAQPAEPSTLPIELPVAGVSPEPTAGR